MEPEVIEDGVLLKTKFIREKDRMELEVIKDGVLLKLSEEGTR